MIFVVAVEEAMNYLSTEKTFPMKKLFTLVSSCFCASVLMAQLPNPSFETWVNNTETNTTYLVPQGWVTVDAFATALNNAFGDPTYSVNATARVGNANTGSYAAQAKVDIDSSGDTVGGGFYSVATVAQLMDLAFNGNAAGFTLSTRPATLNGYYKKSTFATDFGMFIVLITKWNTSTNSRDTLTYIQASPFLNNTTNWTQFSIPLTYAYNEYPDTVLLAFGVDNISGSFSINSTLTIDDLSLSGNVPIGLSEYAVPLATANLYPNPVHDRAVISVEGRSLENASLSVYDIAGKQVSSQSGISGNSVSFCREGLPAGMYFYRLEQDGELIAEGKFAVE